MRKNSAAARKQFIADLKQDVDYQLHKANAVWKEVVDSPHIGAYCKDMGHYGVANVLTSDIYFRNYKTRKIC